jgi:hypothetical protein
MGASSKTTETNNLPEFQGRSKVRKTLDTTLDTTYRLVLAGVGADLDAVDRHPAQHPGRCSSGPYVFTWRGSLINVH